MNSETIVSALFGTPIANSTSNSDILVIQKSLIDSHNSLAIQQNRIVEPKFLKIDQTPCDTTQLIRRDIEWLCAGRQDNYGRVELIRELTKALPIVEVSCKYPDANLVTINDPTAPRGKSHCLAFRTPLLHLIHSIFSKMEMLVCADWKRYCVPDHGHLIDTDEYSDVSLLFGIIDDIYKVYVEGAAEVPISPPHLLDPYAYCEHVEAARRFVVAHEIAHIYHSGFDGYEVPEWFQLGVDANQKEAQKAYQEFCCDRLALKMIVGRFPSSLLDGPELYEFENSIIGIQQFFTMLSIADMALAFSDQNRIAMLRSWERLMLFYRQVNELEVIRANPRVLDLMNHKVKSFDALKKVLSGATSLMHVAWGLEKRFTGEVRKLWIAFQESYQSLTTGGFSYTPSQHKDP